MNNEFESRDNCIMISKDGELVEYIPVGLMVGHRDDEIVDWIVLEDGEKIPITIADEKEAVRMAFTGLEEMTYENE